MKDDTKAHSVGRGVIRWFRVDSCVSSRAKSNKVKVDVKKEAETKRNVKVAAANKRTVQGCPVCVFGPIGRR